MQQTNDVSRCGLPVPFNLFANFTEELITLTTFNTSGFISMPRNDHRVNNITVQGAYYKFAHVFTDRIVFNSIRQDERFNVRGFSAVGPAPFEVPGFHFEILELRSDRRDLTQEECAMLNATGGLIYSCPGYVERNFTTIEFSIAHNVNDFTFYSGQQFGRAPAFGMQNPTGIVADRVVASIKSQPLAYTQAGVRQWVGNQVIPFEPATATVVAYNGNVELTHYDQQSANNQVSTLSTYTP